MMLEINPWTMASLDFDRHRSPLDISWCSQFLWGFATRVVGLGFNRKVARIGQRPFGSAISLLRHWLERFGGNSREIPGNVLVDWKWRALKHLGGLFYDLIRA